MKPLRSHLPLRLVALAALAPTTVRAQDKATCAASYEAAQVERNRGHLTASHEQLVVCAHAACPAVLQRDCLTWLREIEAAMPSVVVQAVGADGRDTLDVAVTCDGVRLAERLDGRAMPMDPGLHSCRFEMSAAVREEQIVLREGEQRKPWRISFAPPADAKPEAVPAAPAGPIPPAAWVLGGVGLAAIGVGTVFEIHGFSQKSDLDRCRPACARSSVDATRASFIVGDVAIGVGLVSVAAGALLALSRRPPVAEPPRARLDVTPYVGQGAGLRFEGAF